MTWFRVGPAGGGIPAALKTDMNSVLNKKFGTIAQNYPPNDWPDDVNLLGMLEEKTASGSIAHISDGAPEVPIKSWEVSIPANLTGVSFFISYWAGLNFYPSSIGSDRFSNNSGATHTNNNGVLVVSAAANNNSGVYINTNDTQCALRNTLKLFDDKNSPRVISFDVVCSVDNVTLAVTSGTRYTYTIGTTKSRISAISTGANCSIYVQGADLGASCTFEVSDFQVEYGSVSSAYTPYDPTSFSSVSLGRTVYGANVDVLSGQGGETYKKVDLSTLTWSGGIIGGNMFCWYSDELVDPELPENSNIFDGLCDNYTPIRFNGISSTSGTVAIRNNGVIYVNNGSDSITPSGNVVYKLAAEVDFTFTPISRIPETPDNNVLNLYTDIETESTVVYRSSGTVSPVGPSLITKNITENGTYTAAADNADGYSSVLVDVPPYSFMPTWTETKIVDNSGFSAAITFSEDYHNFQMLKFVIYNSTYDLYDTIFVLPSGIDKAFLYSSNKFCLNQQITGYSNQYVTYQSDSLLEWSRVANRNCNIYEVYGMAFSNATMTTEVIYTRDAIASSNVTPSPPTGKTFFDYDAIIYMCCTSDTNITHFCKWWISKPKFSFFSDSVGYGIPLFAYNTGKPVILTETSIGNYNFFYVVGIKFSSI